MIRFRVAIALGLALVLALVAAPRADVKTQQKTQVKFEGLLGGVYNVFGGKSAREGVVSSVAVKGDRKVTVTDNRMEIVDLAEEKVYDVDLKGKSYTVKTFAEIRKQIEDAQAKARENMRKSQERQEQRQKKEEPQQPEKEYQVDFNVKNTGEARNVNGFDCKQSITTITVHEKGKTLEETGGVVLTVDSWLAPKVPALAEVMDFDRRYAMKLMGSSTLISGEQMAAAMAMWPGMKDAMAKYQAEGGKLSGTPISSTMTFDGVQSEQQAEQQAKDDDRSGGSGGGMGGLLGGLGKRLNKKKAEEPAQTPQKGHVTIMTMLSETLSVATSVAPADLAIPAGFRQK